VAHDITARKKGEEALLRKEAYLEEGQRLSHTGSELKYTPARFWVARGVSHFSIDPDPNPANARAFFKHFTRRNPNLSCHGAALREQHSFEY